MEIIFFVLVASRTEVCKPVTWICFEITFTLTWFEKLNQEPKGYSWHEEKQN